MKMPGSRRWLSRTDCFLFALCSSFVLTGCGSTVKEEATSVTIPSLSSEDVVPSCTYDLTLDPKGQKPVGLIVMFARGDTNQLYADMKFREAAWSLHYGVLWVHECFAASFYDLQADAAKGPGRMLFAAISQLAQLTKQPELETAGVILYGFSAAGVLVSTMANDYPDRILGVVQYASGSSYVNLDKVVLGAAAKIPTLNLANADDTAAGTARSFHYFQRGRKLNAPWAYGVQNGTQHCCNLSTESIFLPWMRAIAAANAATATPSLAASVDAGTLTHFVCTPDGISDSSGEPDCKFTKASVGGLSPIPAEQSGWLPDGASGSAWLAWVTNPGTN